MKYPGDLRATVATTPVLFILTPCYGAWVDRHSRKTALPASEASGFLATLKMAVVEHALRRAHDVPLADETGFGRITTLLGRDAGALAAASGAINSRTATGTGASGADFMLTGVSRRNRG